MGERYRNKNLMQKPKGKNPSSIRAREMFQIIGRTIDMPYERVQDVFQSWYEIIEYCIEQNIDIPLPSVGTFTTIFKKTPKKGDTTKIPKGFILRGKDGKTRQLEEDLITVIEEDRPDYYLPHFKFYKSFRENIKEETKHFGKIE